MDNEIKLYTKRFCELSVYELYRILQVRSGVFVVEQNCIYQDLDDDDQQAVHVWITDLSNNILAVARVCAAGTHMSKVSIGRVTSTIRGKGYGMMIIRAAVDAAICYFKPDIIEIEAQEYTRRLYEKVGFRQTSDVFILDGIPHIRMTLNILNY